MGRMSERALRDYAFKVLKSEYGEREEKGVIIPAKYTDAKRAELAKAMTKGQLEQMYDMMDGSERVE